MPQKKVEKIEIANSHPGHIITDEKVQPFEKCSVYGKSEPVLESDITRMVRVETKGCVNLIRGFMAEEFKKTEKRLLEM